MSDDNDEAGEIDRSRRVIEVDLTAVPRTAAAANALIERQRAIEIADMAAVARRMGITVDLVRALELAVDPGALGAAVLAAAAARDEESAVVSTAPPPKLSAGPAVAGGSPLLDIARERAAEAERKRGSQ